MNELLPFYEEHFGKPDQLIEISPAEDVTILLAIRLPKEGRRGDVTTLGLALLSEEPNMELLVEIESMPSEEVLKRMAAFFYEFCTVTAPDGLHLVGEVFRNNPIPGFERMNNFILNYMELRCDLWLDDDNSVGHVVRLTPLFDEEADELEKIADLARAVLTYKSGIHFGNPHREKSDIVYDAVYNAWASIAEWYTAHGVSTADILNAALAKEKTKAPGEELEKQLGFAVAEDFKQSFNIVNESVQLGKYYLSTLDNLVRSTHNMGQMAEAGEFEGAMHKLEKHWALRPVWWHKHWIPIGKDSWGMRLIVDMAPPEGRDAGQINYHEKVMGPDYSGSCCFLEWLYFFHESLTEGKYIVTREGLFETK